MIHAGHIQTRARSGYFAMTDITAQVTAVTRVTRHSLITQMDHDGIDKDEVFKT
jgi:hypothetical protein